MTHLLSLSRVSGGQRNPLEARLGRKLLGWLLLFSLVPLLGSNMLGYLESQRIIEGLIRRQMSAIAEVEAQHVDDLLDHQLLSLEVIADGRELAGAVEREAFASADNGRGPPSELGSVDRELQRIRNELWEYEAVYVLLPDGSLLGSAGSLGAAEAELGARLRSDAPDIDEFDAHAPDGTPQFRVSAPIRDGRGHVVAYLGALMRTRGLAALLQIPAHLAGSIESFVLDDAGRPLFVSHAHGDLDYGVPLDIPPEARQPRQFVRYADRDGVEVFSTAVPIHHLGWDYLAEFPVSSALGPLRFLRRVSVIFGTGLAVVLAGLSWFVAGGIVAPVRRLADAAGRIGRGDLEVRVPPSARDEIGELGHAFNQMADDLSRTRARVEELHRAEIERAQQLATVGELASGVAHEIKNPAVGISNGLDLVARRIGDDESVLPIVTEMQRQAERIELAVRDLLEFARPAAPKFASADGNRIAERALRLVQPIADKASVTISYTADAQTPRLVVDSEMILQALVNLMINAVQATPREGRVSLSLGRSNGTVAFRVSDTGPGIPEERVREIFKPFFTTRHSGSGLGLSISQSIVQRHGGRIEVESRPGEGSTFTMRIPTTPPEHHRPRDGTDDREPE